ncbi:MAG: nitroreductase family protein [bacterium]|nr:nitroreductase family protein [bacterium]
MFKDTVLKNRSYRRFYEDQTVTLETLKELVDLARLTPSGANLQPLKYILSCEPEKNALIFQNLAWAGYLKEWDGPVKGERPTAYIIILGDTEIAKTFGCDYGITAQTILLGAVDKGLGGCMLASIKKEELRKALNIPAQYEILLALAIGKPKETVVIDKLEPGKDIKYWRDAQNVHHVPKRELKDIIL